MIPELIHKVMIVDDGDLPAFPTGIKDAIRTFKSMNPKYILKIYSLKDCLQFITTNYGERMLKCFNLIKPYAYKSDFFRYLVLYKLGGWYSDIRQVALMSFDTLDKEFYCALDTPPNQACMYNAIIGCVPRHPIIKKSIDMCVFNIEHLHYGRDCLYITGPGVFMSACVDFIRRGTYSISVGRHIVGGDGVGFTVFDDKLIIKNKYNNAIGADNSDVQGTNNYGLMWRNWDVY
jgi:mannosyltransferase OCH1-like enzyme